MNAKDFATLIAKFVLEGFAAGILIYVATVEMLAEELNNHHSHSSHGFIKGLALSSGAFTFYVFNYLIHV
jgi:zinc transporter ZupT